MQHPQQTLATAGQTDPFENYLHSLDQDIVSYLDNTIFFMIPSQNHVIPLQAEAIPNLVSTSKEVAAHALPMAFFAMVGIGETEAVYNGFHQVYEKYAGRVLLLGDPGAGKATTLMAFARDAVSKRQVDTSQPLPLLAPIATWDAEKQPSVTEWLASITPKLQAKDISRILEEGNPLLLFDGLDELGSERAKKETKEQYNPRQRFIQLIPQNNRIVVTCRVRDYQEVGAKVALNGAVTLQSLTDTQIKVYLCDLPELWKNLQVDNELRHMARTPLLLGLFTFAFAGRKQEAQKLRSLSQGSYVIRSLKPT
jgi:NACHT domain